MALTADHGFINSRQVLRNLHAGLQGEFGAGDWVTGYSGSPYFAALQNSWHPDVSGDVQYAIAPRWMWGTRGIGATHGSPYAFDAHAPIMLYGPAWIGKGRIDKPVEVTDIAPTLAKRLGIAQPSATEGQALPLMALTRRTYAPPTDTL